jgi:hypothetical protein
MFDKKYEDRLASWRNFRNTLETSNNPIQDVIDFYKSAPYTRMNADPYSKETWPGPWELLDENLYCDYCKILGICYTLQLTDRFIGKTFEIHIGVDDKNSQTFYLLKIDKWIIGYDTDTFVTVNDLPNSLYSQEVYVMPPLH